ncbi:MAG TPA: hypothetical protein DDZ91_14280 [Firmicutes bacterium]|nr:hypothetical protein [Bacillota bacterium]
MINGKVTGRFIIKGDLLLESPLLIGTGEKGDQNMDIVVQKDEHGLPYIPASSLCGALRHYFFNNLKLPDTDNKQLEYFWGSEKKSQMPNEGEKEDIYQSSFLLHDLKVKKNSKPSIVVRDGVKINDKMGVAEEEKKFDYEVVEQGAVFKFSAEVVLRDGFSKEIFLKVINTMIKAMSEKKVTIGAMTTKGFGRCRLEDYQLYEYDFECKKAKTDTVISWLKGAQPENRLMAVNFNNVYPPISERFMISAIFFIKNSLIVKAYSGLPEDPDAIHIGSRGKNIIPGTSIKGAIRARAVKILNTLGLDGNEMGKELFGWAPNSANEEEKKKSRMIVEEVQIAGGLKEKETQFRTKIDRFTGGVTKTALFDATPVWGGNKQATVTIDIRIDNCEQWEAGLMLLLLKDLWDGDLPLGGEKSIGRGVLCGKEAHILVKEKCYTLKADGNRIQVDGDKEELESLVTALVQRCEKKGA